MVKGAFKGTAAAAIGGLLTVGVASGCTPKTQTLACQAVTSTAQPSQNSNVTITVRSAAGALVLTGAGFKSGTSAKTTATNRGGHGTVAYAVGAAKVGYPVKVAVLVVKGSLKGSCSTTFIPRAAPSTTTQSSTPPATLQCADVNFGPDSADLDFKYAPAHASSLKAIGGATCAQVSTLATDSRVLGPQGYWPVSDLGYTCSFTWNSTGGADYTCSGARGASASWTIATFANSDCTSSLSTINGLHETNADCTTASDVASQYAGLLSDPTQSYQGYSCSEGPSQKTLCYSADKLKLVEFVASS